MKHIIVALSLLAIPAHAEEEYPMMLGVGATSGGCGEWGQAAVGSLDDTMYAQWVLGYLSAVNVWAPSEDHNLTMGRPNMSVLAWARNWCRSHPLEPASAAVGKLMLELASHHFQ
jgi:hypothetical protein